MDDRPQELSRLVAGLVKDAGGHAFLVGGSVRDRLLGLEPHDLDLEVFGLSSDALEELLAKVGTVHAVGRAFSVYKLTQDGVSVDVSLPRKDSKVGPGHTGFEVTTDEGLSVKEASARRDLTVNAILEDPLTGEITDPHHGREDLKKGILRRVSDAFSEDPLRALRVVRFAARLGFAVEKETAEACRQLDLTELPRERVFEEIDRWLLETARPSLGINALIQTGATSVFPELVTHLGTPHEGSDAWKDLGQSLDRAAALREASSSPRSLMFATLFSPLSDEIEVHSAMKRITSQTDLLDEVTRLAAVLTVPAALEQNLEGADGLLRRLALFVNLNLLCDVSTSTSDSGSSVQERGHVLDILHSPPQPLLRGGDLVKLGMRGGKEMGVVLEEAFRRQLDSEFTSMEGARAWAKERINSSR